MELNHDEIMRLTEEYGGQWGINHTRRLLQIISLIGEGQTYNAEAVWLAAHLHDWGAYGPWPQKDVDHAIRSTEVAESFLTERGCAEDLKAMVLECIRLHHSGGASRSIESILLSDADAVDFLGVVGVLRDFSKNPKDMRKAYETTRKRRAKLPGTLCLEKSQKLAVERLGDMDALLEKFEEDSRGYF